MPSFISHTIMAYDAYNKIDKEKVDLEYMLTYSLGGDLCKYAKCRYDSHHKYQDLFIDNMVKYIKENNLIGDKEIMGVLYGHVCHHIMDNTIHPLIKKIESMCNENKKNHTLIEEYYDKYLTKKRFKKSIKDYLKKNIVNARVNKKISKMLDYVYEETYNTKSVSRYYRFNLFLYRLLRRIHIMFSSNMIERISGVKKFLNINSIDLVNSKKEIIYKDYSKKECKYSLDELYDECLNRFISYYKKISI